MTGASMHHDLRTGAFTLTFAAPAPFLTANQRLHYMVKYRRNKLWRDTARRHAAARNAPAIPTPARVVVTIHRPHRRGRWDATNWAPTGKPIVDGLVDAGVLPDDSNRHVTGPDMRPGDVWESPWGRAGLGGVTVTVEPLTGQEDQSCP